jgi:hypothetical protein
MPRDGVSEQRMFGGICFMLNGNMVAGSSPRGLLLRVGKDQHAAALGRQGSRPMEMRGKPMAGYICVDPASLTDAGLRSWLDLAIGYVMTLPPKNRPAESGASRRPVRSVKR